MEATTYLARGKAHIPEELRCVLLDGPLRTAESNRNAEGLQALKLQVAPFERPLVGLLRHHGSEPSGDRRAIEDDAVGHPHPLARWLAGPHGPV